MSDRDKRAMKWGFKVYSYAMSACMMAASIVIEMPEILFLA